MKGVQYDSTRKMSPINICTKEKSGDVKGVYKQYGIGKSGFDVTSCQFAFHYFFKNKDTILSSANDHANICGFISWN